MDFRDLYKQTEKVGMEEFSKIVSSKGIKSLNESGDPKVMVTAKENDSVTFLVGDKKYVYKGLSPSLIDRFEGRLKNKAGFKALNWLKAQTAKEQRFEVKDGKEVSTNESSSFPTNFTKILKTSSGKIKHPADKGYEEVKQDDRGSKAVHYRCTTCNKPHDEKESAAKCCRNYESKINERDSLEAWRETIEEESKKIGIKSHSKMDVDNCLKFIAKHYGAIQANKAIDDFKLESKGYKKLKEFKENDGTPEPQKSVTFTPEKLKELKKIYASTIKDGKSQFTFEGQELLVSYAKYLIQHLENVFGTGKNECKVNESADDMSDEELMAWYKEEMSKGLEPRLINSLKLKLKARGLKVDESKKVNEDDMMNGGATTASDSSNVVANPNPPTVDNDVNKEEQDQVKKSKSTKDDIADDAEKEEDEESKKDLTYLGNSGGDKYFYLYEKPAAEMDESVEVKENRVDQTKDGWVVRYKEGKNKEVKTKKFPTKEEADKFLAKVVIDEKTDTPFDPSFGSKVRAKGLADRTPAGIPTDKKEEEIKLPNRKEVLDKHFKANDEVEELEKSWKADNSKVPNESKITEISQKDIPSYLSAHIKRAKEIGQDPINYLMTRFGHTKKEAQIALEKYGKEDYKEPIQGDYYPESIVHIPYTLVEKILKIVEKSKINELGVAQRVNFNKELHDLSIELSNAMKNNDHNRVIELKKQIARFSDNNESKVNEVIKKIGRNKWQVQSHTGKNLGTYGSEKKAHSRLAQVEMFKAMDKEKNESKFTTSSDTSGQPANYKAAAQDVKDSASHEKSQTGLGQVKEDTDYDDKTPAKIADLQILDAEDEVVFSAKKHQLDPNDVKGFLTAALKELDISNISYDVVIDYLLPTEDEVVNPEEPTDEELKAEPTEEPYPAAQGEPVPQQQDKNESIDKSLLEKFGLTPPIEVDGSTSMWAPGEDDSPDANTDEEPVNPYEVDESLMLKYGFLTESTATLFEKFGLIIDEANENLSPEDIARIKNMVDKEWKEEHKDKLTEPKKDKKVNEIEDLSTPDVNGVPSITGVDQEKNQLPTNQQADKAPGIVEKPGVGILTTESKVNEDGEGLVPNQPTSDPTVNQDVPPQGEPTATDDPTMADSGEDTDKEPAADYSTPESAMAQIDMDYPEEPLKSLALAFCDSFINDPNVYKGLRKMQFEGTWVDADTINDLAKVVGDYRNFTPDVIKLTSERLGNGCKYKLGRNNGPTLTLVLRDPDFSISLSGLKELVNAKEVNKTDNPGEVVLSW